MAKIIMLGTGNGGTLDLYNTCFVIQIGGEKNNFLVDIGGSVEIIRRLEQTNIKLQDIQHIFISHSHTDHLLGLIWMFKKMSRMVMHGEIKEKINIYCNDVVYEAIQGVSKYVLPSKLMDAIYSITNFIVLKNKEKHTINNIEYTFFDLLAKKDKQYGFECDLEDNRFVFLGDETLNPNLYDKIRKSDYVMHEAFCLDKEEPIFHAYEKSHSTVLSTARVMNELEVKNLILYHTEESHGLERKRLYTEEANSVFKGNVLVPNDLEEIILTKKKEK